MKDAHASQCARLHLRRWDIFHPIETEKFPFGLRCKVAFGRELGNEWLAFDTSVDEKVSFATELVCLVFGVQFWWQPDKIWRTSSPLEKWSQRWPLQNQHSGIACVTLGMLQSESGCGGWIFQTGRNYSGPRNGQNEPKMAASNQNG